MHAHDPHPSALTPAVPPALDGIRIYVAGASSESDRASALMRELEDIDQIRARWANDREESEVSP